jgi:hypothetical protein
MITRIFAIAIVALFCSVSHGAQPAGSPPEWARLTSEQRAVLRNLEKDWDSMPGERRGQLLAGADRWLAMTPEQQSAARERFSAWQALPERRREVLRRRYQEFRAMTPEQQQRIRDVQERVRELPPGRRDELQRRWREAGPEPRPRERPETPRPARPGH